MAERIEGQQGNNIYKAFFVAKSYVNQIRLDYRRSTGSTAAKLSAIALPIIGVLSSLLLLIGLALALKRCFTRRKGNDQAFDFKKSSTPSSNPDTDTQIETIGSAKCQSIGKPDSIAVEHIKLNSTPRLEMYANATKASHSDSISRTGIDAAASSQPLPFASHKTIESSKISERPQCGNESVIYIYEDETQTSLVEGSLIAKSNSPQVLVNAQETQKANASSSFHVDEASLVILNRASPSNMANRSPSPSRYTFRSASPSRYTFEHRDSQEDPSYRTKTPSSTVNPSGKI
jgi:hypothetical protein